MRRLVPLLFVLTGCASSGPGSDLYRTDVPFVASAVELDGVRSEGEWAAAAQVRIDVDYELLVMHDGRYLYLADVITRPIRQRERAFRCVVDTSGDADVFGQWYFAVRPRELCVQEMEIEERRCDPPARVPVRAGPDRPQTSDTIEIAIDLRALGVRAGQSLGFALASGPPFVWRPASNDEQGPIYDEVNTLTWPRRLHRRDRSMAEFRLMR